jgi:hypothetical protein
LVEVQRKYTEVGLEEAEVLWREWYGGDGGEVQERRLAGTAGEGGGGEGVGAAGGDQGSGGSGGAEGAAVEAAVAQNAIGQRVQLVHVLAGSVLQVWGHVENALRAESKKKKIRIVRAESTAEGGVGSSGGAKGSDAVVKVLGIMVSSKDLPAVLAVLKDESAPFPERGPDVQTQQV